ncbi:ABCB family ABC transporter ATP-binding protein/permease [Ferrimonas lipolytica]|uniref:ABC transporter ATP-binding protein/permease n=1 Tax=Ferrimonas lipolytica TaxID=2724191 RepID=A0A6H1UBQ8_9GAMM|nr:ABC transporter ATP-binding protein/permease [Ferrimonas lipolytica]QIZ76495.1 ABC transporter ATP-binding protein/permease [Ferrimonas lipolytica]
MRGSGTYVHYSEVNWRTLGSLLPYLMEFRGRVLLALLCLVAAKVASVGLPFILKEVIDNLDGQRTLEVVAMPLALLVAYGVVRFANVLFGELRDTLFGRVTERAMRRVGLKVFSHLHNLDLAFHLNRQTGGLSREIERGVNGISFLMRFMVFNIGPTLLEVGLVIGLLWKNYQGGYALIVFIAVVLYISFSVVATEWRTSFVRQMNAAESASSTRAIDSLINFETVKYFANEQNEADAYDEGLAKWEQARRKNRLSLFALNGGQSLIIAIAMTSAMVLAASDVLNGAMTLGDFALINAFMMQVFMPLGFLGFVYREMKGSMANIEKMFGLLAVAPTVQDKPKASQLNAHDGSVTFNNVSFRYQAQRPILTGLSFTAKPMQKVALVGASGAGKSTISKLLLRFYDVDSGSVEIDGQDIRDVSQYSLRKAIGVVPQDTVLFNNTILENVRYGRLDATDAEVMAALKIAHLEEFVKTLPDGLATKVGERGLKLSGGEKQRVAIARAVLKRPKIMVFDEATSSLDSRSEQSILAALADVSQRQTTLVIAHRLSTIVDADQILVIGEGQIIEQGDHHSLLERDGAYTKLWRFQQNHSVDPI